PGKLIQTSPRKKNREDICPGTYSIINLDLSKYDKIASRFKEERDDDLSYLKSGIETKNRHFNAMIEEIEQVAIKSEDPILLTGPTGAGKSRLARKIYDLKHKKLQISGDFVEINCATLKGDNAMSALFGHKKGSYTGAVNDRPGLLKTAHKGIVFLDEIGELGLDEQAMLLRAIEDKCFIPLGSDRETNSDFQLICGTNKNLYENVTKGTFREDLLSRINLWDFTLPGLKERPEDIEPNIKYELSRFAYEKGNLVSFNQESYEKFLTFALSSEAIWSSNFRDLNGAVTRMCTLAPGGRINERVQSDEIKRLRKRWQPFKVRENEDSFLSQFLDQSQIDKIDNFDKPQLVYTLEVCKKSKNLSEAGRILYNNSRLEKKNPNDADRLRKYLD
ncbi:MAG: AAA family ATPase, partial [bacterium]|nr:AAA family ATPase [bacterium]